MDASMSNAINARQNSALPVQLKEIQ